GPRRRLGLGWVRGRCCHGGGARRGLRAAGVRRAPRGLPAGAGLCGARPDRGSAAGLQRARSHVLNLLGERVLVRVQLGPRTLGAGLPVVVPELLGSARVRAFPGPWCLDRRPALRSPSTLGSLPALGNPDAIVGREMVAHLPERLVLAAAP